MFDNIRQSVYTTRHYFGNIWQYFDTLDNGIYDSIASEFGKSIDNTILDLGDNRNVFIVTKNILLIPGKILVVLYKI